MSEISINVRPLVADLKTKHVGAKDVAQPINFNIL